MHWFPIGVALLVALAILWIGIRYLIDPLAMAPSFGLPLPGAGSDVAWWLRLKGVRDVASGLVILTLLAWGGHRALGLALLAETAVPLGDMWNVLAAHGSTRYAFGIHGATALLMLLGAIPLVMGMA